MRVTVLVASLTHGGAEKVASLWLKGFTDNGYETSCIVVGNSSPISYTIPGSVIIKRVNSIGQGIRHNLCQIHQIRRYIKELHTDVLITVLHPLGLMAKISCIGLNVKIINTEHNTFERPSYAPFTFRQKIEKFWINKLFNRVTIFTHADLNYIGDKLSNTVYLPNPLSFVPVQSIPEKKNIILAVGRLESWHVKGFDLLIKVWGELYKKYPEWKLQILGGGKQEYRDYLVNIAKENGAIDSILFTDFTSNPIEFFSESSIFVLSSRYEGFGMVLLEAMSQGCACIACDYKGRQSEILPSTDFGITCAPDNVQELSSSISYMIENSDYRESIRYNAIRRSSEYTLDKIMERWINIIDSL